MGKDIKRTRGENLPQGSRDRAPSFSSMSTASSKLSRELNTCEKVYDDPRATLSRQVSRASAPIDAAAAMSQVASNLDAVTTATTNQGFEIDWNEEDDNENPKEWPLWYKGMIIGFVSISTTIV